MKKIIYLIQMILFLLPLTSCDKKILEYEMASVEIKELSGTTGDYLLISGLCLHSSYTVNNIEKIVSGDSVLIVVYINYPPDKHGTGRFELKIPLENVKHIFFGTMKKNIWESKQ